MISLITVFHVQILITIQINEVKRDEMVGGASKRRSRGKTLMNDLHVMNLITVKVFASLVIETSIVLALQTCMGVEIIEKRVI